MKHQPLAVAATALALLARSPAIAGVPIVVRHTLQSASGELTGPSSSSIAFENANADAATKAVFDITGGGYHQRVVDDGTFAPFASIDHTSPDYAGSSNRAAALAEAEFINGIARRLGSSR